MRMEELFNKVNKKNRMKREDKLEYEKIESTMKRIIKYADTRC